MLFEPSSVSDIRYRCPVCLAALFPPVFQCQNGHLMCKSCISQLANCAVCRVPLPVTGKVRNLEVERIIRIIQHPCPNEDDGCDAMVKFDKMEHHRLECNYTKFPICKEILGHDCEEMTICEYAEHYEWAHKRNVFIVRRKVLPITYTCRVQSEPKFFRPVFSFRFQGKPTMVIVTFSHNKETDLVTCKPYILAGRAVTNQFSCKISLLSGENVKIMSQSPIFNLQTEPGDLQHCLSLPLKYLLSIFCNSSASDANAGKCRVRIELSEKVEIRPNGPRNEDL